MLRTKLPSKCLGVKYEVLDVHIAGNNVGVPATVRVFAKERTTSFCQEEINEITFCVEAVLSFWNQSRPKYLLEYFS